MPATCWLRLGTRRACAPAQARYDILATCVLELHRVGILDSASPTPLPHSQLPVPNQVG